MLLGVVGLAIAVHFSNLSEAPEFLVDAARRQATELFREIGVEIDWHESADRDVDGPGIVRMTLVNAAADRRLRNAEHPVLGVAMRTALDTRVSWVYYARVAAEAERHAVPVVPVLASAMAHEIAHLLQSREAHSPAGLMSARWSRAHFRRAALGTLRFTAEDAASLRGSDTEASGGVAGRSHAEALPAIASRQRD